ncbi:hypothetical protein M3Y97_00912900 [Aphelenchoides bicaudatus]|nr:hypothetical protein M3Y97_00912900 [Aphelenchoides bicaudatus]
MLYSKEKRAIWQQMNRLLRFRHFTYLIRYKSSTARKPSKKPVALPDLATEKIKLWQTALKSEIDAHLSEGFKAKGFIFSKFHVDPTLGNILELKLPTLTSKDEDNMKQFFKPGAWVDVSIEDIPSDGFVTALDFEKRIIEIRTKDVPPALVYRSTNIVILLPDDRFALDFLLDFWKSEEWRRMAGAKNFLWAHRVAPPMLAGKPRGRVKFVNQNLNKSQMHAVDLAMQSNQTLLTIQGPPGTGKTDVVAEIVVQYYRKCKNVLVLAATNKAVDNVAERVCRLMDHNIGQYQLTQSHDADANSSPCSINDAFKVHKNYQDLEEICNESTDFWADGNDLNKFQIVSKRDMYEDICKDLVSNANVIFATFTSAQVRKLKKRKFSPDLVVIDEAAQAPEALTWYGVLQASRAIIVGDQNQLGPVLFSPEAIEANYGETIMAYLFKEFGTSVQTRLKTQYRSNEKIMLWSNDQFYDGELEADESVKDICVQDLITPVSDCYTEPLVLIDTLNAGGKYFEQRVGTSYRNIGEAQVIDKQVRALISSGLNPKGIGVITPYRGQVNCIMKLLHDVPDVKVSSVDAFQGRECEVILMSLVRSKRKDIELGFLTDLRRMNVSVTRAKRQFFLVANSMTMNQSKELAELLNVIKDNGRIESLSALNREDDNVTLVMKHSIMEVRVQQVDVTRHEDSTTSFPAEVHINSELCNGMLSEFYSFDRTREELLIHLWSKLRDYYWNRKDARVISKQSWVFVLNFKILVDTTDYEDAKAIFRKFDNDSMFRTSYRFSEENVVNNTAHYTLGLIDGNYSHTHSLVSKWNNIDTQLCLDFRHSLGFVLNGEGGTFYLLDNIQEIRKELTSVHSVGSYRSDGDSVFEMIDSELLVLSKNYREAVRSQVFLISVDIQNSTCTFLGVSGFSVRSESKVKFVFDISNQFHAVSVENREMQFDTRTSTFNVNPMTLQLDGKILRALIVDKDAEMGKYGFFDLKTGLETLVFNEKSVVKVKSISSKKASFERIRNYSWLKHSCYMIFQAFSYGRFELYVFDNEKLSVRPILFRSVMDKTFSSFHINEEDSRLTITCKQGNRFYRKLEVFQFPSNVVAMLPVNLKPFYQLPLNQLQLDQPPLNQLPLDQPPQDPVSVNSRKRPLSEED